MLIEGLSAIDPNTMILGLLFVIFYVLIKLVLGRSLKDNPSSGIIAFCVSLLAVYGISRTSFDLSGFFYNNIGLNENTLYTILPIIIIAGLIFIFATLKIRNALTLLGVLFIIASFFVYRKTFFLIIGIILLILGIILMINNSRKNYRAVRHRIV
jgi:hypothetical protein